MNVEDLQNRILLNLINIDEGVSLISIKNEFKVSVGLLTSAIQNLKNYRYIERKEDILKTKVSEQIKRHFYLDILKIQIESVPIFQC